MVKIQDKIWKIEGINKGVYTTTIDEAFESLKTDFRKFAQLFIRAGDSVRYSWQHHALHKRVDAKFSCYDIKIKSTKNVITIKLKRKSDKNIIAENVARRI